MIRDPLQLPPIGEISSDDHGTVTSNLANFVRESRDVAGPWLDEAEENVQIYADGGVTPPGEHDVVSNHIQDDVQAITDQQTKEPAVVLLDPVDRNEPGDIYLKTMDAGGPLTPQDAQILTSSPGVDPATGQPLPPRVDPSELVTVDEKCVAKFYQQQFDVYWQRGRMDRSVRQMVLYTNIFGWMTPIYEWRDDTQSPKLWTNVSLRQMYLDPTAETIEDANYVGVDWAIDAGQAKAMFPDIADLIDERAQRNAPRRNDQNTQLGSNVDLNFQRDTIVLRVFWLRNQLMAMTPDEAIAGGHVQQRQVPVTTPADEIDAGLGLAPSAGDDPLDGMGDSNAISDRSQQGAAESDEQDAAAQAPPAISTGESVSPDAGGGASGAVPGDVNAIVQPSVRMGHFLPGTDTEVTHQTNPDGSTQVHPQWPRKTAIRQITVVQELVADDRVCEYWDIPVLHNVAIPIPYLLFGRGLPQKLKSLQAGRNRAITNMVAHSDYYGNPVWVFTEDVWDKLPEKFKKDGCSKAGLNIVVPAQVLMSTNGQLKSSITPDPLPSTLIQVQEMLKAELDERSAHAQVTEGKAPAGVTGWQSIQLLQQSAQTRYGFAVQWTADAVYRLGRLLLHSLVTRLSVADLLRVNKQYPEHVARAIRAKAIAMDWDIDVTINTGTGATKSRKQAEALQEFQVVDPATRQTLISFQTLRERMGEDPERESNRCELEQKQAQAMQAQVQMQQMARQAAMQPAGLAGNPPGAQLDGWPRAPTPA